MEAPVRPLPSPVTVDGDLRPIFGRFLDIQRGQIEALGNALVAGDQGTAVLLAHTVRGAAATYQLPEAAAVAAAIEEQARGRNLAPAAPLVDVLRRYFREVEVVFRDERERTDGPVAARTENP
ncbi:Hpt domain protein [Solidesulfovibrio carbinoliphilus subsp. oakridgensis]|uniref:Hpt domain protein n=1 Tax=Solidesulfovibrio carbinoliphilus subsp. oakridgensis TaxID=694327 RepID=G7QAX7_9BACT|nr:Hpt domain-containing protein [Solidesulfovibrio carbinoliphilus]EHJ48318.1 Hpt domain protein [Solidesulfovibrio carbinoliphilus subsp. oakridgensis]